MQRIHSIDYLRGVMAMSILIYHYTVACFGVMSADTLLGRLGLYGVSAFYVISGISLFVAYQDRAWCAADVKRFVIRRVFRIAPLYWFATILMIVFFVLSAPSYLHDWERYFWNFSLLFGFFEMRAYIPMGGWSIGNEMVFYTVFPLVMLATRRKLWFYTALISSFLVYVYFAFWPMAQATTLVTAWSTYINPFNQIFLFVSGVALGLCINRFGPIRPSYAVMTFVAACALFVIYPAYGNTINLVSGWNRIVFTAIIITMCLSVLHLRAAATTVLGKILKFFGDISYSVYLLHGAAMDYTIRYLGPYFDAHTPHGKFNLLFGFAFPFCIFLAAVIYYFIEKPMVHTGRRLSNKLAPKATICVAAVAK